jgi:methylated-DNA-[protein]-cysteine S-methyltransferase
MGAIVKSAEVRVERTEYAVAGWGEGELWTRGEVVLAHEFRFCATPGPVRASQQVVVYAQNLVKRFEAFLGGERVGFDDVRLDLDGFSSFQRAVADVLQVIPRGEVVTYGELAALAGHPGAQRAVGTFCARNRFMFLLPCHRVVAADGIGAYGSSGTTFKRRLLALEGVTL